MRKLTLASLAPLGVVASLVLASPAAAKHAPQPATHVDGWAAALLAEEPDAVVLPARVQNAIDRMSISLDAAMEAVDTGDSVGAGKALKALQANVGRADRAARAQMNAVPEDPEGGGEAVPPGPDSVVAVLTAEQGAITAMVDLFDGKGGTTVDALTHSLFGTLNTRDKLLDAVIALDPEGPGADYADGMADTVAGYDDEVANAQEALAADKLSAGGRKVVQAGLKQSQAAQAKVTTAFGGGE
jgi:hypothetical protein